MIFLAVYNSTQGNGCFTWWFKMTLKENCTFLLEAEWNHQGYKLPRWFATTQGSDYSMAAGIWHSRKFWTHREFLFSGSEYR
jgi:transposase InsO family protein